MLALEHENGRLSKIQGFPFFYHSTFSKISCIILSELWERCWKRYHPHLTFDERKRSLISPVGKPKQRMIKLLPPRFVGPLSYSYSSLSVVFPGIFRPRTASRRLIFLSLLITLIEKSLCSLGEWSANEIKADGVDVGTLSYRLDRYAFNQHAGREQMKKEWCWWQSIPDGQDVWHFVDAIPIGARSVQTSRIFHLLLLISTTRFPRDWMTCHPFLLHDDLYQEEARRRPFITRSTWNSRYSIQSAARSTQTQKYFSDAKSTLSSNDYGDPFSSTR